MDQLTAAPVLRVARLDDLAAIQALIDASVRALSVGFYTPDEIDSGMRWLFGADTQLLRDGTYFVCEVDGAIVAGGGWSRRATLFGGDQSKGGDDPLLDPATDPARIRAFFVHPQWARRGLGRQLFDACHAAARDAGFRTLALLATLPGEPLYRTLGFTVEERVLVPLPDGVRLAGARMARPV